MAVFVEKEGIFTSLQDLGRFGLQRFGVPPGGAMDRTADRIVNILVGNDDRLPVLELHFPGPQLVFEEDCLFALGGAAFDAELDGQAVANWQPRVAHRSSRLRFRRKLTGARCYIAVNGGFLPPEGDRDAYSTRRLTAGERLLRFSDCEPQIRSGARVSNKVLPLYDSSPEVRIIAGAEFQALPDTARSCIEGSRFSISRNSDRMGYRLAGPPVILGNAAEMISAAVSFGTIQLLPDGDLIILMADHQVTGGYPRIGHIISADLPLVAQLGPGDSLMFRVVSIAEAEAAAAEQEVDLNWLKAGVTFGRYWK